MTHTLRRFGIHFFGILVLFAAVSVGYSWLEHGDRGIPHGHYGGAVPVSESSRGWVECPIICISSRDVRLLDNLYYHLHWGTADCWSLH